MITGSPSVTKVSSDVGDEATSLLLHPILHDVEVSTRGGALAFAVSKLEY